jgi:hypothetical protein
MRFAALRAGLRQRGRISFLFFNARLEAVLFHAAWKNEKCQPVA